MGAQKDDHGEDRARQRGVGKRGRHATARPKSVAVEPRAVGAARRSTRVVVVVTASLDALAQPSSPAAAASRRQGSSGAGGKRRAAGSGFSRAKIERLFRRSRLLHGSRADDDASQERQSHLHHHHIQQPPYNPAMLQSRIMPKDEPMSPRSLASSPMAS